MPSLDRAQQMDLVRDLYNRRETPELVLIRKLVEFRLEEAKERLVVCPIQELQRYQGLAAAYQSLLHDLTHEAVRLPPVPMKGL